MNQMAAPPQAEVKQLAEALLARSSPANQRAYRSQAECLVRQFAPGGDRAEVNLVADQLLLSAAAHVECRRVLLHLAAAVRRLAGA